MITSLLQIHFILIIFLVPLNQFEKGGAVTPENYTVSSFLRTAPATAFSDVKLMDDGEDPVVATDDDIDVDDELQGTISGLKEVLIELVEGNAMGRSPPPYDILNSSSLDRITLPRTHDPLSQAVRPLPLAFHNVVVSKGGRDETHSPFALLKISSPFCRGIPVKRAAVNSIILFSATRGELGPHQASPDPFNPETMIRNQSLSDIREVLKVYSLRGKEVRSLDCGSQEAGYSSVCLQGGVLVNGVGSYRPEVSGIGESGNSCM